VGVISGDTKDALARDLPEAGHCRAALLAGLAFYGSGSRLDEFVTHRNSVARLFWSLLDEERKSHPIQTRPTTRLQRLPTFAIAVPPRLRTMPPKPVHRCDRLTDVRSAFLACGSLAAGTHGYHLEFVMADDIRAERLQWMLRSAGIPPKVMRRKGRVVVYYKDFDAIVELLSLIGAFSAVLRLEDVRALRETKNRIHRLVNTEAANLERTAAAAAAQRRVIEIIDSTGGLSRLTPALREIAELRLRYPDESLSELGRRCNPPIAKPTASSRLSALARLARRTDGKGPAKHDR
jgi:DNA-binding transcriptional regulator WhiA